LTEESKAVEPKVEAPKGRKGADPDGLKESDFESHDWALGILLRLTVDLSVENSIGLSVVAGGSLVSGIAIHREKWLELLASQIRAAGVDGSTDVLAGGLETLVGGAFKGVVDMKQRRDAAKLPMPATHFLHFRDARVYTGQWVNYAVFRVNLADVTGWSIGSHEA
jgi:hypothetical protein